MIPGPSSRPAPRLLAIVDLAGDAEVRRTWLASAIAAGVPGVWSRDRRHADAVRLAALVDLVRAGLRTFAAGRADLCRLAGAAGVHLSGDGLGVAEVRRMLGPSALIGRSTHSLAEVAAAAEEGADYVVFGPVWATPGKGPALGSEALREASQIGIPVLALGGVDAHRVAEAAAAGAWGVAGIRCCEHPPELGEVVAAVARAF